MVKWERTLLLQLVVLATACDGVPDTPDAAPQGPAAYTGVWHATGGDGFGSSSSTVQYIELTQDGTGALRTSYEPYGVLGCGLDIFHVDLGGGLLSMDLGGGAGLYRYDNPDPDHLVITTKQDATISFERVTDVPASAKCRDLASTTATTDIRPKAGYWSGLAFQSSSAIWYTDDDSNAIHSVNPTTGVVTPANANTNGSSRQIQAFEGANYWAHCACGSVNSMQLLAPGGSTVTETLDTSLLGNSLTIYGVAPASDALWVAGNGNNSFRILKITGASGARVVADSFDFASLDGIAAIDGKLWGLSRTDVGTVLVEIDLVTKKAAATYKLPPSANWDAITAGSGSLWLFGAEPDGDGQLLRVTP